MEHTAESIRVDSDAWLLFVKVCFAVALGSMLVGIAVMPIDLWMRGYMVMGTLFLTGATMTLSKTVRDQHEARTLIHQLAEARTKKLLKECGVEE
ncbi:hypothetical protein GYB61_13580 [bacterium]|nr:hypothetical protein [bacterium]